MDLCFSPVKSNGRDHPLGCMPNQPATCCCTWTTNARACACVSHAFRSSATGALASETRTLARLHLSVPHCTWPSPLLRQPLAPTHVLDRILRRAASAPLASSFARHLSISLALISRRKSRFRAGKQDGVAARHASNVTLGARSHGLATSPSSSRRGSTRSLRNPSAGLAHQKRRRPQLGCDHLGCDTELCGRACTSSELGGGSCCTCCNCSGSA